MQRPCLHELRVTILVWLAHQDWYSPSAVVREKARFTQLVNTDKRRIYSIYSMTRLLHRPDEAANSWNGLFPYPERAVGDSFELYSPMLVLSSYTSSG